MEYYEVNISPSGDREAAFLSKAPDGTIDFKYLVTEGSKAADRWPEDARGVIDTDYGGSTARSLVGNTLGMLIVSKPVQEVMKRGKIGDVEFLPLALYTPKKKLLSSDYFVVNPIGTLDCLDLDASVIDRFKGKIASIDEPVLSKKKLKDVPELFRIQDAPRRYVFSEGLIIELKKVNPDNFFFTELKQA